MTDPINKDKLSGTGGRGNNNQFSNVSGSSTSQKLWKDNCCWRFNRNKCKKSADECDWDHRCTYCGGWYHSFANCRKRLKRDGKNGDEAKSNSPRRKESRKHRA